MQMEKKGQFVTTAFISIGQRQHHLIPQYIKGSWESRRFLTGCLCVLPEEYCCHLHSSSSWQTITSFPFLLFITCFLLKFDLGKAPQGEFSHHFIAFFAYQHLESSNHWAENEEGIYFVKIADLPLVTYRGPPFLVEGVSQNHNCSPGNWNQFPWSKWLLQKVHSTALYPTQVQCSL